MKHILICIKPKLSSRMVNATRLIVKKCNYVSTINKVRLLGLAYNSIPIQPRNMNRIAVLMGQVKSI